MGSRRVEYQKQIPLKQAGGRPRMPDPKSRDIIGKAMKGNREQWIVQGHIGSTWQNGQYVRTRDLKYVVPAFEDILKRMQTDYIDLGMIHYVDAEEDWNHSQAVDSIIAKAFGKRNFPVKRL